MGRPARRTASFTTEDRLVEVVTPPLARFRITVGPSRGEHPLPDPFAPGIRVLPGERGGQLDPASALLEIALVPGADGLKMPREISFERRREHCDAILVALSTPHHNLIPGEIDVLDAQAAAFEQAKSRSVEQRNHEPWCAGQRGEDCGDLLARQDYWQTFRALGPDDAVEPRQVDLENVPVEEEEGAKRLVLRGRGDAPIDGQRAQEARDLGGAHLGRVALAMEEDVAPDPRDVRRLGARAAWCERLLHGTVG